jgi:hypothetical protein
MKTTRYFKFPLFLLPLFMFTACGQTKNKRTVQKKSIAMEIQSTTPGIHIIPIQTLKK